MFVLVLQNIFGADCQGTAQYEGQEPRSRIQQQGQAQAETIPLMGTAIFPVVV